MTIALSMDDEEGNHVNYVKVRTSLGSVKVADAMLAYGVL